MAHSYSINEFRTGLRILLGETPYVILEHKFTKPGKGQAFTKVKMKNLLNGSVLERTYKLGETAEAADIQELSAQFLYYADEQWTFMDTATFEQYVLDKNIVAEAKDWLIPECVCQLTFHSGTPIGIEVEQIIELKVAHTEPGVKGDTAGSGATKPAILETGVEIRVPLFIEEGDILRIDTRQREYLGRAKS